ncbi:3-oxoacyl-ACP reductase FabG [Planobispora takensis]|uniref:Beta-ketoacyl-ACP reductase n=1 Tax=Planobispora takensis TaxID=1367882 RepID=A0A8J3T1Y8_9ACTN|nr:3-oxoacyl-ACP reductase FabG [Planobispora takensis]GII02793.1 beta-ketoacyl-ACP reductase [Planobispora takensis]
MTRSVLVTGGARGIGLAVARAFAAAGDKVTVTYRTTAPPPDLPGYRCDVTSPDDVSRAITEVEALHGPVEVLIANAGVTRDKLLLRMTEDDFDATLDTNLRGAFRVAKRVAPAMLKARRGRIVFISSTVGLRGEQGQSNYAASKAGLIGFARSLAWEFGKRGVTVNVVAPGLTDTDMTAVLPEQRIADMCAQIPLQRMATPEEIADVVRFVASPQASYLTGAVIPVDGGASMGH